MAKIEHADADIVYAGGIAIDGSTLYVGDRHVGVRVFDVSDPLAPVSRGATSGFEGNLVRMQGSNVLVTGLEGRPGRQFAVLRKYDLSDPADPVLVSSIRTGATPYALAAGSSCAYVGFGMPNQTALIVDTGGTTMTAKSTLLAEVDTIALTTSRNLVVASRRHYGVDLHRVTCR